MEEREVPRRGRRAGLCPKWKCAFNSCWPWPVCPARVAAAGCVLTHPCRSSSWDMGSPGAETCWGFLEYKTEKYVMTRNWRVGALQRLLQLGLLAYVVG